jgi:hypothetical protein
VSEETYQPLTSGALWGVKPEPVEYRAAQDLVPDQSAEFDARHPELAAQRDEALGRLTELEAERWPALASVTEAPDPRQILTLVEIMPRERYGMRTPREWKRFFLREFYGRCIETHWAAPVTVPKYSATLKRVPLFGAYGAPVEGYEIRIEALGLPIGDE